MEQGQLAGHRVLVLESTGSTNAVARQGLADGTLAAGDVVLADRQEAGRGRRGRRWVTVPGRSLAATVLLAPANLQRPTRLTLLGAVAACRALARLGIEDLLVKWPNDLMRAERKVGGILVERAGDAHPPVWAFGIGINLSLRAGDLPAELEPRAGDVGMGQPDARQQLLEALLVELDLALAELGGPEDGRRGEEYQARAWIAGRTAELRVDGRPLTTEVLGVSGEGDLLLPDGVVLAGERVELVSVGPGGNARALR